MCEGLEVFNSVVKIVLNLLIGQSKGSGVGKWREKELDCGQGSGCGGSCVKSRH